MAAKKRRRRKRSNFDRLVDSLAHRKNPPRNPRAVAASIGDKKFGASEMARRSAASRKQNAARRRRRKTVRRRRKR